MTSLVLSVGFLGGMVAFVPQEASAIVVQCTAGCFDTLEECHTGSTSHSDYRPQGSGNTTTCPETKICCVNDSNSAGASGGNVGANSGGAANVALSRSQCEGVSGRQCKSVPGTGDVCQPAASDCGQCCMPSSAGANNNGSANNNGNNNNDAASAAASTAGATGIYIPTKSDTGLSDASLTDVITGLASSLLEIFGVIAVIAFIVTGFQYMLANGDEKEMQAAKRSLTYSIVAVIVALSGVILVRAIDSLGPRTFI